MHRTKISYIGTAVPQYKIPQKQVVEFMQRMMNVPHEDKRKLRIIFKASGIEERFSVIDDYNRTKHFDFYPNDDLSAQPSTADRMKLYETHAPQLATAAIKDCLPEHFDNQSITHLITFSCTGMYAPGLDLDIVERLGLSQNISRTCINFMGCYAAFNALKTAYAYANAFDNAKVLIVGVELCTLHFQEFNEYDHIIANSIFGDGAAAALIEKTDKKGLNINQFYHAIVPEGKSDMAWRIQDTGFHMRLSSYVPNLLKINLQATFKGLFSALGTTQEAISHYAVHPGGKKIIQAVETALSISNHDVNDTYEVLRQYGNMSSVSVLFVLKRIFENIKPEEQILAMAFGPGLTVEAALLES